MVLNKKLFRILLIPFFTFVSISGIIQCYDITAETIAPLPIFHHEMVYDSQNNQLVLFGGEIKDGSLADFNTTWIFSSINQSWSKLSSDNSPGARSNHQMAYNTITGKILLFGGISKATGSQVNDTWEFNPTTNLWTELHPTNAPSARAAHEMYFDPEYNEVILYAGVHSSVSTCNDMWAYNFTANNWYEINHTNSPGYGYGQSFVYDEVNKVGVFFGGRFDDMTLKNDVWLFNRSSISWIKKEPTIKPQERYHLAMVYNPIEHYFVMFGGDNEFVPARALSDTWIYNSQSNEWAEVQTNIYPPACCKHEMVYDQYLDRVILFGGVGEAFSVPYNEMWFFNCNTSTWSQYPATTAAPIYFWVLLLSYISIATIIHAYKIKKS
ncbi:MAG: hypothetical protein FK734_17570 [Asgard group archaeon]|nr:hypothetical protein [Asgard group archaeon]